MESPVYFMLLRDAFAKKFDKVNSYCSVFVSCGSLWVLDKEGADVDRTVHSQLHNTISIVNQITLHSCELIDVSLSCCLSDVVQINEMEFQLLLAISSCSERKRVLTETELVQDGCQIYQRYAEQLRSSQRCAQSEVYVYVLDQRGLPERAAGVVQYIGPLPSSSGIWFGVKLALRYQGQGMSDGTYKDKQFFECAANSAVFVAVNKICSCLDYSEFDDTYDLVQGQTKSKPPTSISRREATNRARLNDWSPELARPPLELGERVVWISDYGPELGTVKWIGILPDSRVKEYTIGVEFDKPIGTGTGKYNNEQLFRTLQNHASLIPVLGLMKAEEFYGSKESVPSSPFIGATTNRRCANNSRCSETSHSSLGHSTRNDCGTPSSGQLGMEPLALSDDLCHVKEASGSELDEISEAGRRDDISRYPYSFSSKTTPHPAKSSTYSPDSSSQFSSTPRKVDYPTAKAPPPLLHEKHNPETEKSIYDKEPEHYYENVEKDATGRLLNRDTDAFRMDDVVDDRFTNARSNSGDDLSATWNHSKPEECTTAIIHRSCCSVDNIFSDEKVGSKPVKIERDEPCLTQLPYRTGRSVFYERLEKSEDLNNWSSKLCQNSNCKSDNLPKPTNRSQDIKKEEKVASTFVSPNSSPSHGSSGSSSTGPSQHKLVPRHPTTRLHYYNSYDVQRSTMLPDRRLVDGSHPAPTKSLSAEEGSNGGSNGDLENELVPKSLNAKELNSELDIGSMVEVDISGSLCYGVIRWIGYLKDKDSPIAGIELEDELSAATDGRLGTTRLFDCGSRRGFFTFLHSVRKDGRFTESSKFVNRTMSQTFGSMECLDIVGQLPPLTLTNQTMSSLTGINRGIQGHNNSCYMDAALFSMFAFTSVCDSILHRPKQPSDIGQYNEIQQVLREGIVNPLRTNCYVRADKVLRLRMLLDQSSTVQGLIGDEKDPEEFLTSLLQQTLKIEPFLRFCSGQEVYLHQLFMDKDEKVNLPTTQQLLELSFLQADIKLSQIPFCLILQMPRFGKDFRMFRRIVPSLYLDITDVLEFGIRECTICGNLATNECKDCFLHFGKALDKIVFCDVCLRQSHGHTKRTKHQPKPIRTNPDYERYCRDVKEQNLEDLREKMELFAVICIKTSHYVSFVKGGTGPDAPWVFFDSMADRKGEQHGYNIPCVEPCPFLPHLLQAESYASIDKYTDDKDLPDQMRRLLCDGYICMYQSCSLLPYR